jgi:hypothetical protein
MNNIFLSLAGCQSTSLFATRATDKNGEYAFTQSELNRSNEGIILSKSQYFDRQSGTGEVPMQPEAWVKIAIKTNNIYPDTSKITLSVIGELGEASYLTFKAPKDSTVDFRIFGNETNVVNWLLIPIYFHHPASFIVSLIHLLLEFSQ